MAQRYWTKARRVVVCGTAVAMVTGFANATDVGFFGLRDEGSAQDVNDAGVVVLGGLVSFPASLWTVDGGYGLSVPQTPFEIAAYGTQVVGINNSNQAFWWSETTGDMLVRNPLGDAVYCHDVTVSGDGQYVIATNANQTRAFTWSPTSGVGHWIDGLVPGDSHLNLRGMSRDGYYAVGGSWSSGSPGVAVRYNESEGLTNLGSFGSWADTQATAISNDHSVMVGFGADGHDREAFLWREGEGYSSLGQLGPTPGFIQGSIALDVSADGSVVVGTQGDRLAWIWTEKDGMRSVSDVLAQMGIETTNWTLESVNAISADGTVLVGSGSYFNGSAYEFRAWVAVIPSPGGVGIAGLSFAMFGSRRRS